MVVRVFTGLFKLATLLALFLLVLPFIPMSLDFEPQANTASLPGFVGPLAPNNKLDEAEFLFKNKLRGPESLAVYKGSIYTGTEGGEIYKITGDKVTLVAKLGKKCGAAQHLLPAGTEVEGKRILFLDDLDIDDKGALYITEASGKWQLNKILYTVMEHEDTGRVLKFDTKTRKTTVLMKNLRLPNGVQLSQDKQSLLVCELSSRRVLRHHLGGARKGQTEVFADNLPGEPDNIRPSKSGGYWVAFATGRGNDSTNICDLVARYPLVKKATMRFVYLLGVAVKYAARFYPSPALKDLGAQLENGWVLYGSFPKYGLVVELDVGGRIVRSLHSPQPKIHMLSEVLEHEGHLYLGSYRNPYLGRVKL
ncbi:adipocyte plasma membrane-associated protein [Ixodes scapularis]